MDGTLDLGEHFERFVAEQVSKGRFGSASEVVREGLALLERSVARYEEQRADFSASIEDALASGPAEEVDFEALKAEARRRLSASPADAR